MEERQVLGLRAYARHRGVAPNAVRKAISSGRIASAVVSGKDGRGKSVRMIDVGAADKLWKLNTDEAQQREPIAAAAPPLVQPGKDLFGEPIAPPVEPTVPDDGLPKPGTFAAARVVREVVNGKMADLRYQQAAKALVPTDRAREIYRKNFRKLRDKLIALAPRFSHDFAAEDSPAAIEDRYILELELVLKEFAGEVSL